MPVLSREDFSTCVNNVLKKFPEVSQLNNYQAECLFNFIERRDVFAMLPTGFGKSLIFQMVPGLCEELHLMGYKAFPAKAIVLVLCPLVSLMESHVRELTKRGFTCICLSKDGATKEKQNIHDGKYSFVFASPESVILNDQWRKMLQTNIYQENLFGIVTDEAHVIPKWGYGNTKERMMAFRECFSRIGELRSLVPDITPILALTATATQKTMEMVKSVLSLKSDNYTVTVSPNRANIYLYKAKVNNSLGASFGWLIDMLKSEHVLCPKVIVYCKAVKDCGKLFNFFKDSLQELVYVHGKEHVAENMIIGMFHHNTLDKYKERIINSFYVPDGVCRVAFATNALGMGINFADVRYVVHYGPPRSVEDFVQEIGRAGRDGKSSTSVLLYQGKHLCRCERKVKEYAKSNTCLRSILLSEFGVSKPDNITAHDCCLACHKKCCCVEDDSLCNKDVPLLLHKLHTQGIKSVNPVKKRNVGKNDLCLLEELLRDYQKELASGCPSFYLSPECTTGFSDTLVKAVLSKAKYIFTVEYILESLPVFKFEHGVAILHMVADVFEDFEVNIDPAYEKTTIDTDFNYDLEYGGNYGGEGTSSESDETEDSETDV